MDDEKDIFIQLYEGTDDSATVLLINVLPAKSLISAIKLPGEPDF